MNIRKALQYDSKNNAGLDDFIHKLPMHLRLEVSEEIHKESFQRFNLFKKLGNKNFLAWLSARLKQQLFADSVYFYSKGDYIESFFFCIKGLGAFVLQDRNNEMISIVDPDLFVKSKGKTTKKLQKRISVL